MARAGWASSTSPRIPGLKRLVAIKLLPPDLTRDATAKQRFLQEAQAASALDHPNICTIFEINETADGQLYLMMAHYEGETLKERIGRGPLAVDDAIDIASQVGQGLAKAHAAGIVHRDIKPANLMVTADGTVKILDFGLAKLMGSESMTGSAATLGTVAYMSPEQAQGRDVDGRTDIWSLGAVLYEMVTGQIPFEGENLLAIAHAIQHGQPTPLTTLRNGAPTELQRVVSRTLAKRLENRYPTAADLLAELRTVTRTLDSAGAAATVAEKAVPSIAVLPFADMSPGKDQDYFCEGVAEELIDALTKLKGLRVAARTSSFQFKGRCGRFWAVRRNGARGLDEVDGNSAFPAWSLDGERVYFGSVDPPWGIHSRAADGSGERETLLTGEGGVMAPFSWTPDSQALSFNETRPGRDDIWTVSPDGDRSPYLVRDFWEGNHDLSPDGRWMAYNSNESGGFEVYIQRYPDLGEKVTVSTGGGGSPLWSPDGSELSIGGRATKQ